MNNLSIQAVESTASGNPLETNDTSNVVNAVAKKLAVPIWRVKLAMGIPITAVCNATTALEAKEACDKAEQDSEEEFVSALKWIELEEDIVGLIEIRDQYAARFEYVRKTLYEKWNISALKIISTMNSEEELLELWDDLPADSDAEIELIKKFYGFYAVK